MADLDSDKKAAAAPLAPPRPLVQGGLLGAGVLVILALLVMVNYLSLRHYQRFDWTTGDLYTLSDKSLNVARGITKNVDMVLLMNPQSASFTAVNELLDRYAAANPEHLRKRELDPGRNRLEFEQLVQTYGIQRDNVLVLATRDEHGNLLDKRIIDEYEMAEMDYSGMQFGQPATLKEFKGEKMITSGLLALVESRKPRILFTKGHGEASIEGGGADGLGTAREMLGRDNFEIEEWSSLGQTAVPTGTDLLVIAGPQTHFLEPELAAIGAYLGQGGHLLVMADIQLDGLGAIKSFDPALSGFLAGYGVEVGNDIVFDPTNTLPVFGPGTVFTASYGGHEIVQALQQTGQPVLFPITRSIKPAADKKAAAIVTPLVSTSEDAWADQNPVIGQESKIDEGETRGAIALAVAAQLDSGTTGVDAGTGGDAGADAAKTGKLVVFGDIDFATDGQVGSAANSLLLLNTFNWLVSRTELIDIQGRQPEQTKLSLQPAEYRSVVILTALMPLLAIAAGIWIFIRRRR